MVESTQIGDIQTVLISQLEEFSKSCGMEEALYQECRMFIQNNFSELISQKGFDASEIYRDDQDGELKDAQIMGFAELFDGLNPTLKEELFFHQFADKIDQYDLFCNINNQDCKLSLMKRLEKITYEAHSQIYLDSTLTDSIFFVIQGKVKLVAENNFAFAHFNAGEVFGETDVLCDISRNGTALAVEHCVLYLIDRDAFINSIVAYPEDHQRLLQNAIKKNRQYVNRRYETLKKNPLYGHKRKTNEALLGLQKLANSISKIADIEQEIIDEDLVSNLSIGDQTIDDEEVQILVAESQIKKLNKIQKSQFEATEIYTNSVQNFVASGRNDSWAMMESYKKQNVVKKIVTTGAEQQKQQDLRAMALAQLPSFVEIKEIQDLVNADDGLGDDISELTLDTLASFNEDMKVLALNAFQVQDMLDKCVQENDLLIDWMGHMEFQTTGVQDKINSVDVQVVKTIESINKRSK